MPGGYIGCFKDSRHDRVLNGNDKVDLDPNSSEKCKQFCREHGYRYAGTESGEECFCGNIIRKRILSDECDYECEGNSAEFCGGDWRISIYDTWLCAAKPCKNGATCLDIDANNYNCSCTNEWMGENCEQEKPLLPSTATSMTTTTTRTTQVTTVLKTTSPVNLNSTESNLIVTSTTTTTNTSEIQYKNSAGDSSNSMIAMYVLLPLSLCFMLIVIALVLKRRCLFKKQPIQECVNLGPPGRIPDIIANVMTPKVNHSNHRNESQNQSGDIAALAGDGYEYSVIRKERRPEILELEEYNTITLRPNNKLVPGKFYDHVAMQTNTSDKTYSQLSASSLVNEHDILNNTYSHIEKSHEKKNTNGFAENRDNTYNTLLLEKIPRSEESCKDLEVNSEYDHTGSSREREVNDYTNVNMVKELRNVKSESSRLRVENIYYNE